MPYWHNRERPLTAATLEHFFFFQSGRKKVIKIDILFPVSLSGSRVGKGEAKIRACHGGPSKVGQAAAEKERWV
jgi:hypothetical protein